MNEELKILAIKILAIVTFFAVAASCSGCIADGPNDERDCRAHGNTAFEAGVLVY